MAAQKDGKKTRYKVGKSMKPSVIVSICLLGFSAMAIFYLSGRPEMVVSEKRLTGMPMEFGNLKASTLHFDDSVYAELNADENVFRQFQGAGITDVFLYVGYYGTAKGGRTGHLPMYCYTGQGWAIDKWEEVPVMVSGQREVMINRMLVHKGSEREIVYFWFQAHQHVMASGLDLNLYKFFNRLLYNQNDGAFVRVSQSLKDKTGDVTDQDVRAFTEKVIPIIAENWPVESQQI